MDGEFGHLCGELAGMGVTLNETLQDEHVGDIERYIRTVKECMRGIYNTLPFDKIPTRLVVEMAKASMFWLNGLPLKDSFGNKLSPRAIITGQKLDYNRHCRYQFGEYVQTHGQHDNSMNPRTVGALALRPTGNAQGSYYFMSISTGRVHKMALPMPDEVVDQIHRLARQQRTNPGLLFGDRNMNSVDMESKELSDDEDDEDYIQDQEEFDEELNVEDDDNVRNHDDDEGVDDENDDYEPVGNITTDVNEDNNLGCLIGTPGEIILDDNPGAEDNENEGVEQEDHDIVGPEVVDNENPGVEDNENEGVQQENHDVGIAEAEDENQDNASIENDKDETVRDDQDGTEDNGVHNKPRYNFLKNCTRSSNHVYDPEVYEIENKKHSEQDDIKLTTVDDVPEETPQMSMKKGLKMFGEGGYAAVKKEMQQLHDQKVMQPVSQKDLSQE